MKNKQQRKADRAYKSAAEDLEDADAMAMSDAWKREARILRRNAKRRRSKAARRASKYNINDIINKEFNDE